MDRDSGRLDEKDPTITCKLIARRHSDQVKTGYLLAAWDMIDGNGLPLTTCTFLEEA